MQPATDNLITRTQEAVDQIIERAGPELVVAAPLGLGKPNPLINAIYARVKANPALKLTMVTALSLARPSPHSDLEKRFLQPFIARFFGDNYPDLDYIADIRNNQVPSNIRIEEFYMQSGSMLGNTYAQRHYASINYTHVARAVAERGANVLVQIVAAKKTAQGTRYSLSCNTDVSQDLIDKLRANGKRLMWVAVVHPDLPFLGNDAEVDASDFDLIVDDAQVSHTLFALPHSPINEAEFALGMHASSLVRDGGTLQIGIGALSDALVYALKVRHTDNEKYLSALSQLNKAAESLLENWGGTAPFSQGLYGASEMLMDGFMHLRKLGILRRHVFDDLAIQNLLNQGKLSETLRDDAIERMWEAGAIRSPISDPEVQRLVHFGILPDECFVRDGVLHVNAQTSLSADLSNPSTRHQLAAIVQGRQLRQGRYLHGAFYLGSKNFYQWLHSLQGEDFSGLCMTRVSHINELYGGQEALHIAQRHQARFFNTCMMTTLLGAAVSDALDDGQVVSGVGGQYNFVAMAHAIPEGRSILLMRAVRESGGKTTSNIVFNYAHTTIPRHLRDIVVTEYGIADLRGKTDEEVIKAMLSVTDARFVDDLATQAKTAGKLDRDWQIPESFRRNLPEKNTVMIQNFRKHGLFSPYPFANDFDDVEQRLIPALQFLKLQTFTTFGKVRLLVSALLAQIDARRFDIELARMNLNQCKTWNEKLTRRLLTYALSKTNTV